MLAAAGVILGTGVLAAAGVILGAAGVLAAAGVILGAGVRGPTAEQLSEKQVPSPQWK